MNKKNYNLLLADDDEDDRDFFYEALADLPLSMTLITVNDGVQLMKYLSDNLSGNLPDFLFLDLNMPRKSGLECLSEIKSVNKLKDLPIVIFSTSLEMNVADLLYKKGANHFIQKPNEFGKLKEVIENVLTLITKNNFKQSSRDQFILHN